MLAYQCSSTGLLFPGDYIEEWGRKYGIGLGPVPVSEAWETMYDSPVAMPNRDTRSLHDCGHPIRSCCAPVFPVQVTAEQFEKEKAICASEDPRGEARWKIVRAIQVKNKKGRIHIALNGRTE